MKKFIKQLCKDTYSIYRWRLENEKKVKKDLVLKPFIYDVLDKDEYKIHLVNLLEKWKGAYNKNVVEYGSKLLNNLDKYDIDILSLSKDGLLWSEFIHEIVPTKKNNKQIYLSFKGRNNIKAMYGKVNAEQFIKRLFSMQNSGWWKTLFIDSTERFKIIEKRFTEWLFTLSNIPNIYYVDKETKTIYMTVKKTSMVVLLNILWIKYNVEDIKMVWIMKKDEIKEMFKLYLNNLYWYDAWKRIEVQWSFLNSYSNLKDISNMIEWPNDIFQDWLRKLQIPYDDQFIKRIITDDIITDSKLEGFFLYYKNLTNTEEDNKVKQERLQNIINYFIK